MIIVLFHVLYLLGKFVYQSYRVNKEKAVNDDMKSSEDRLEFTDEIYRMIDPDLPEDYKEKTLKFFPPAYVQRYTTISNILSDAKYQGKLRKIVDFGCSELGFLVYLKNTSNVEEILCVDIDRPVLEANKNKAEPLVSEYIHCRTRPLVIEICEGSVTENDKKLENADAVTCIELIEHLYPDTLADLPHNIFGYIKPKVAIITTPNADFNVLFPNFKQFRHYDHKFEWSRQQFKDWAENVTLRYPDYEVTFDGICKGPDGTDHLGCSTQMAIFHRYTKKSTCIMGVEGLFKTVAVYEYPYRVDNRTDEQKILDDATYYIRQLSFQDIDMQDEVPLNKLLAMLQSFHITIESLKATLQEAGWAIEERDSGPVVLVPQLSTFSDYSTVDQVYWDNAYSATDDDDDWNAESGSPVNSSRFINEECPVENWHDVNWDEEPSIIIPQNASVTQNNTYLYDGENSLDLSTVPEVAEVFNNPENHTESYKPEKGIQNEDPHSQLSSNIDRTSLNDTDTSFGRNVSLDTKDLAIQSNSPSNMNLEDIRDTFSVNNTSHESITQSSGCKNVAKRLDQMLHFQAYMSTSRCSTSPEPYLLQFVQMDQLLKDNSICDQTMSADHWMLNNTLEQSNVSTDVNTSVNDTRKETLKNNGTDSNNLQRIYFNTSCNERDDFDAENFISSAKYSAVDKVQGVQLSMKDDNPQDKQVQLNNSISITNITTSCISELPQFTSSPKSDAKATAASSKRRSTDYSEQVKSNMLSKIPEIEKVEVNHKKPLTNTFKTSLQNTSDSSMLTTSGNNYTIMKELVCGDKHPNQIDITSKDGNEVVHRSSDSTLIVNSVTEIAGSLNNQNVMKDAHAASSLDRKSVKTEAHEEMVSRDEDNRTSLNDIALSLSKQEEVDVNSVTGNLESLNIYDTKLKLPEECLMPPESHVEIIDDRIERKTESECVKRNTASSYEDIGIPSVLRYSRIVNDTESSFKHAKDSCITSELLADDTNKTQSTSVLKNEVQVEPKYKDVSLSHNLEIAENVDLKPPSPEAVETPPNSWSPEIMDSGYPNSASAQDMTPEYDLSSIAQDHISDSESPSVAEAPRLGILEVVEVENGDLANNNRDGEGNNMIAAQLNDLEDLQPFIDVLENDLENENDIYALENDFPIWLLRILEMANPVDLDMQVHRDRRELRLPDVAADDGRYINLQQDEGFDSSSSEDDIDLENNEMGDDNNSDQ